MVRLSVPSTQPLAVQQWQGLIAINYPARAFGLTRHVTLSEAKKLCPNLIAQHVATWREGDEKWAYHDNAFANISTHKVSLDPYRLESRKILATIKQSLAPPPVQRVEKASIDEVFLDLSAQVHATLLERFPILDRPAPYDDPTEQLPRPPTTALDWNADALVDLDDVEAEADDPDWDDVVMLIASEIVRHVRAQVFEKLHYTCSAGIARNKMIAKLGSAHKKPNSQTIVRNRAIQHFLSGFKFTKIRNLGGKLGDEIVAAYNTDTVKDLLGVQMDQFKKQLGDDTGTWLYNIIRGQDTSEVNSRTEIKSMLSAKSFRPSINDFETAVRWLRIFVADIHSRLVEVGVLENKRRPRTINLHHRQGAQTRSKQAPISSGKSITEAMLFDMAKTLLGQVVVDGRAWPCANMSLSVGGFEDGITGNKGIGGFLVRREEIETSGDVETAPDGASKESTAKRRRVESGGGIRSMLAKRHESSGNITTTDAEDIETPDTEQEPSVPQDPRRPACATSIETTLCDRCNKPVPLDEAAEHADWHFAKDLYKSEFSSAATGSNTDAITASALSNARDDSGRGGVPARGRGRPLKSQAPSTNDPRQRKLAFG